MNSPKFEICHLIRELKLTVGTACVGGSACMFLFIFNYELIELWMSKGEVQNERFEHRSNDPKIKVVLLENVFEYLTFFCNLSYRFRIVTVTLSLFKFYRIWTS